MQWLTPFWRDLREGHKVEVRFRLHPEQLGFRQITLAEPNGQVEDWAMPLTDGSRLHLWRMPDKRWVMHRDAFDPGRGPIEMFLHALIETKVGQGFIVAATLLAMGALLRRATA